MLTMIMLVIDAALMLMLMYGFGELTTIQDEQEDRLDALEDYADYLRNELMNMKARMNADNDRADNYVQWRRRIRRAEDSD